ncbi:MAG TPA: metallophosphoesterase [Opitutaceae bacterium]
MDSNVSSSVTNVALPAPEAAPPPGGITGARLVIFASLLGAILLVATWFVSATWVRFTEASSLAWRWVPMLLTLGFVPGMLLGFRRANPLVRALNVLSSLAIGLLSFGVFAALATWVAVGAATVLALPAAPQFTAYLFFGVAALVAGYGLLNAAWLRVTRVTVTLPNLPPRWRGRTVALVSDVHLGNIRADRFVRRIVARLNALRPDAVFLAGDMFDGAKLEVDRVVRPWRELSAPAGVYFVSGNHDEFHDRVPLLAALSRVGVRVLNNEKVTVDGLQIVGVHDGEASDPRIYREVLRAAQIDRALPSILLAHQPVNLAVAAEAGVSLQLSGHTHGGQFWPWSWVAARAHGRFVYGFNAFDAMLVFTSSGAGTWGPPLRVGTRSELVLIRLEA